eukprot:scaffold13458_cov75-Phaeocystis_antarctica.AAC.3
MLELVTRSRTHPVHTSRPITRNYFIENMARARDEMRPPDLWTSPPGSRAGARAPGDAHFII